MFFTSRYRRLISDLTYDRVRKKRDPILSHENVLLVRTKDGNMLINKLYECCYAVYGINFKNRNRGR